MVEQAIAKLDDRDIPAALCIFHGDQMLFGLALSIIHACRMAMPDDMAQRLLQKEDMNRLVNGLFRPQILVPRHLYATPHGITTIEHRPQDLASPCSDGE